MKKLTALFLAAGMVVAASAPANAVDVKVDARYQFTFQTQSKQFNGKNLEDVCQRLRLGLTMAASENLSGYLQMQFGTDRWGQRNYKHGTHSFDVAARQAYIDWKVPATAIKVRMGRQEVGLPTEAFGDNSVLSKSWGVHDGIVVAAPVTDWLGLSALWMRAGANGTDVDANSNTDFFAAVANLKFNGISGSIYAAYAALDGGFDTSATDATVNGATNSGKVNVDIAQDLPNYYGEAYWVGATATLSYFDPFTLKLSAVYGEATPDKATADDYERKGWNVQAKASYKLGFGTPVLGAWYAAGDDDYAGEANMPSLAGRFQPTRTYNDRAACALYAGSSRIDMDGTWGVQAGIEGMSFISGLTHEFLVTYVQGTNDKKFVDNAKYDYLTTEDAFVSFDLVNTYKIYKNLTAYLELSYIINDFSDASVQNAAARGSKVVLDEDDWRVGLTFEYKF